MVKRGAETEGLTMAAVMAMAGLAEAVVRVPAGIRGLVWRPRIAPTGVGIVGRPTPGAGPRINSILLVMVGKTVNSGGVSYDDDDDDDDGGRYIRGQARRQRESRARTLAPQMMMMIRYSTPLW